VPGDLVDDVIGCRWLARRTRRYPSDTSDEQWAVIEPLLLPAVFPPWQTVYWYFVRFEQVKATEESLPVVRGQLRLPEGRDPEPSAG
jgi:transposase